MANENKNTKELVSEDDDPTSELEALTWRQTVEDARAGFLAESEAKTCDFDRPVATGSDESDAIEILKSDLESRSETIDRLQFDIEQLHARWLGLETEIKAREELTGTLTRELDELRVALARREKRLHKRDQSIKALKTEIRDRDDRNRELETSNAELAARLEESESSLGELRVEFETVRDDLESISEREQSVSQDRIIEQDGQLASRDNLIEELRSQIQRTESYADGIRQQLHDRVSAIEDAESACDRLETALGESAAKIDSLSEERAVAVQSRDGLQKELDSIHAAHEDEIRKIRFELGEAQETAAQRELVNEQLAADLVDTRGFKEDLERMLSESEEKRQARIAELEIEVVQLRDKVEQHEQSIATKSEAINCLLAQLSDKTRQIESIGELENVIHDIDDRMSERFVDKPAAERDRVTRLLVGTIDNQELRFPLFKDRLTIGRTQQNDIQLKAPYVSRRHAVVVTEGDSTRVIDWGSKNGVYVNSNRVTEHFLSSGDMVTIGTAEFRYEERAKRDT